MCWPLLPLPSVHACPGPEEAHLGRAVSKAKKPSSHSPSSGQCQQQQQQAQGSPAPMAGPGLHLRAHCGQWGLEQTGSGKIGVEEVWVVGVARLSPAQGMPWVFVSGEGTG